MERALNSQASGSRQTRKYFNIKDTQNPVFSYFVNGFNTNACCGEVPVIPFTRQSGRAEQ